MTSLYLVLPGLGPDRAWHQGQCGAGSRCAEAGGPPPAQKGIKITYKKIEGANHFFDKHEAEVVETVKEYVSNMMSKPREVRHTVFLPF